jgi:predicted nuclease of predicted toxin-antitoxin system
MRFKIDENLPVEVADLLQRAGHEATTVLAQNLGGKPDRDVASTCQEEAPALVTLDTDFADIRAYPPSQYSGLIVLRLRTQDKPHVLDLLNRLLTLLSSDPLIHHLWIVEEERVRIRS